MKADSAAKNKPNGNLGGDGAKGAPPRELFMSKPASSIRKGRPEAPQLPGMDSKHRDCR